MMQNNPQSEYTNICLLYIIIMCVAFVVYIIVYLLLFSELYMMRAERRRYQKDLAPTDDIVTLIHLVRQNPALYNYKLQPNQRRRIDILNGWAQIAAAIGSKFL